MGQLVLGVKALFDLKCAAGEYSVAPDIAAGMLLDLQLDERVYAKARTALIECGLAAVTFPIFLQMYATYCGLAHGASDVTSRSRTRQYWVPGAGGQWSEVSRLRCSINENY
jgi:hypothetical protein